MNKKRPPRATWQASLWVDGEPARGAEPLAADLVVDPVVYAALEQRQRIGEELGTEKIAAHADRPGGSAVWRARRGAVDALRRPRGDGLLRHGEASARTADRSGTATLVKPPRMG
jgi:hypothetical protein